MDLLLKYPDFRLVLAFSVRTHVPLLPCFQLLSWPCGHPRLGPLTWKRNNILPLFSVLAGSENWVDITRLTGENIQMYSIQVLYDKGALIRKWRRKEVAKLECFCANLNKEWQLWKNKQSCFFRFSDVFFCLFSNIGNCDFSTCFSQLNNYTFPQLLKTVENSLSYDSLLKKCFFSPGTGRVSFTCEFLSPGFRKKSGD